MKYDRAYELKHSIMKNFPHQFNNLSKLRAALKAIEAIIEQGDDVDSDEVLGKELAKTGVYTFRDKKLGVEQALALEKKKARASRGTETAARDIFGGSFPSRALLRLRAVKAGA